MELDSGRLPELHTPCAIRDESTFAAQYISRVQVVVEVHLLLPDRPHLGSPFWPARVVLVACALSWLDKDSGLAGLEGRGVPESCSPRQKLIWFATREPEGFNF
jgi:hypothetical protein